MASPQRDVLTRTDPTTALLFLVPVRGQVAFRLNGCYDAGVAAVTEGFRNEALRAALAAALGGKRGDLEALLMRYGGLPGPLPNFKLATAFGVEISAVSSGVERLLTALGDDLAAADTPRAFLPVAAAFGWAALIREGRDVEAGWRALAEIGADERKPLRLGVLHALRELSQREGAADALVERAIEWLGDEDREVSFGATAVALEALTDTHVLGAVREYDRFLRFVSSVNDAVADAPRAASRLPGLRRTLTSLTKLCSAIVMQLRAADRGADWLAAECERATHPDVRAMLSDALLGLAQVPRGTVDRLRKALEDSAKPLRDPSRLRPGAGRGKKTRPLR